MNVVLTDARLGDALVAALNLSADAVCIADIHGYILFANAAALSILKEQNGLEIRRGGLACTTSTQSAELLEAIRSAALGEKNSVLQISRISERPLLVSLRPLKTEKGQLDAGPALVLMKAQRLEPPRVRAELARQVFNLTAAECRIVIALAENLTLAEIAREAGVSMNTLRSQLKPIFRKLNVRRQSELVRLILTLARLTAYE